jgi:hypothetical protein
MVAPVTAVPPADRRRWRRAHPIAAAGAVAVALAAASTAAANGWVDSFRADRVEPVAWGPAQLTDLPDLAAFGDVALTGDGDVRTVPDADAAAGATGLSVPSLTELPTGITGTPTYQVVDEVTATLTFGADDRPSSPEAPAGLDGSQLRMQAGPGLAAIWTQRSGVPALVVGRAVAPSVDTSGESVEVARDHLLATPGLPQELGEQLRRLTADGATLPLPIPAELLASSRADVGGAPATVLTARDRSFGAVVWMDGGLVNAVAGTLDADELLAVARGLR